MKNNIHTMSESMLMKLNKKDLVCIILQLQEEVCKYTNTLQETEKKTDEAMFVLQHCQVEKRYGYGSLKDTLLTVYTMKHSVPKETFRQICECFEAKGWTYNKTIKAFWNKARITGQSTQTNQ